MGNFEKLSVLVAMIVVCFVYFEYRIMSGCMMRIPEDSPALAAEAAPVSKPPDVRAGWILGRVTDAAGSPVGRFSLQVLVAPSADEDAIGLPARESERSPWADVVAAEGEFTIRLLAPGRYRVRAFSRGFAPSTSETVVVPAGGAPAPLWMRLTQARASRQVDATRQPR